MKKIILVLAVVLGAVLLASRLLIPSELHLTTSVQLRCTGAGALRKIGSDPYWACWEDTSACGQTAYRYTIQHPVINGFDIRVVHGTDSMVSKMLLIQTKRDSTLLNWELDYPTSANPITRFFDYRRALAIKNNMDSVAGAIQRHLSIFDNIYGFPFQESSVRDTFFISTKTISPTYPGTALIYSLVDKLTAYCKTSGCTAVGFPMLNVSKPDSSFLVRVALPVNHAVMPSGEIGFGKMVPGKFFVTDVVGGNAKIDATLQQIAHYFDDYNRTTMAIPFSFLVTDRRAEPDSSKWVTRIYAPVY